MRGGDTDTNAAIRGALYTAETPSPANESNPCSIADQKRDNRMCAVLVRSVSSRWTHWSRRSGF